MEQQLLAENFDLILDNVSVADSLTAENHGPRTLALSTTRRIYCRMGA